MAHKDILTTFIGSYAYAVGLVYPRKRQVLQPHLPMPVTHMMVAQKETGWRVRRKKHNFNHQIGTYIQQKNGSCAHTCMP